MYMCTPVFFPKSFPLTIDSRGVPQRHRNSDGKKLDITQIPIPSISHSLDPPFSHAGCTSAHRTQTGWDSQGPPWSDMFQWNLSPHRHEGHTRNMWVGCKHNFFVVSGKCMLLQWRLAGNHQSLIKGDVKVGTEICIHVVSVCSPCVLSCVYLLLVCYTWCVCFTMHTYT